MKTSKRITAALCAVLMTASCMSSVAAAVDEYGAVGAAVWQSTETDASGVAIDEQSFPDETFRNYVLNNVDTDKDGVLSQSELDAVTTLYLSGAPEEHGSIKTLKGIENFKNLENLDCRYNQLEELDLSGNTKLISVMAYTNKLTSVNVSGCTALKNINVSNNKLMTLDLSSLPALNAVRVSINDLTVLNLENSTAIEHLECDKNKLTKIDVSNCAYLNFFVCSDNLLTEADSILLPNKEIGFISTGSQGVPTDYTFSGERTMKFGLLEETVKASDWWGVFDYDKGETLSHYRRYAYAGWYPYKEFVGSLSMSHIAKNYSKIVLDFNAEGITSDMYGAVMIETATGSQAVVSDYVLIKNGRNVIGLDNFINNASLIGDEVSCIYLDLVSKAPTDFNITSFTEQFNEEGEMYHIESLLEDEITVTTGEWWNDGSKYWTGVVGFGEIWSDYQINLSDILKNNSGIKTELNISGLDGDAYAFLKILTNAQEINIGDVVKLKNGKNVIGGNTSSIGAYDSERVNGLTYSGGNVFGVQLMVYSENEAVSFKATKKPAEDEAVTAVIEKIGTIGEVEYTEESAKKIEDARTAYDALTDEQKELVTNYDVLTAAEKKYAELEAEKKAKPANPEFTATAGEGKISLKWTAVEGATSYRVYYRLSGTKDWAKRNTVGTAVTVSGLTGGKKYDFLVTAFNANGESEYTDADIICVTPKVSAPAKPVVTATAGVDSVSLKWNAVSGAKAYCVFYRVNGTNAWVTKNTTGTSLTVSGLTGGKKYDFLVRAYNGSAWSPYTNADIINATPKAAQNKPAFTSITPGVNNVILRWNAVDGAIVYRVFYRISGTSKWTYKNSTGTAMKVTGLTGGKKYDFLIRTYSASGWSSYTASDIKTATPKAASKPTITSATPGVNSVVLRWNAVDGAKSYRVYYRISGTSKWSYKNTTKNAMNLTGLTGGRTYEFVVRAYNGSTWTAFTSADIVKAAVNTNF